METVTYIFVNVFEDIKTYRGSILYHVKRKYWSVQSSETKFSITKANFALRMRRGNL